MKKIAILIPQFYWGGMPQVASKLIKLLQDQYNITLILVNSKLDVRVNIFEARLVRLSGNKVQKLRQLKRVFNTGHFQAVLSFGLIDNFLNIVFNTFTKSKVIITEHSSKSFENAIEPNKLKRILFYLIIKYAYPFANSIVAVSAGIKADLVTNFDLKNVKVIYNPSIDTTNKKLVNQDDLTLIKNIKDDGGKILLNIGRITRPKGQLSLVRMMRYLDDKKHLILLGEGPDQEILEKAIKQHHLEKVVHIVGYRQNVLYWMKAADSYVSLSWYEGFPTAFIEANKVDLPIISADIFSGPREILSNGSLTNYTQNLNYPCYLPNGLLTRRFDFRKEKGSFHLIEKDFAKAVQTFFKNSATIKPKTVTFVNNDKIKKQYIKLIEG